jgi:hypothetical protein
MPAPIKIRIHKKTLVPTKKQVKHSVRSDWKYIATIDYKKSAKLFYYIGEGPLKNDAQFAKVIFDNYGSGEYLLIYWKLGMKGFKKFMQVDCDAEGYQLTKATVRRLNSRKKQVLYKLKKI